MDLRMMPPDNHNGISEGAFVQIERLDGRINTLVSVLEEREKRVLEAFAALLRATDKAEHAQKLFDEKSNEFRRALEDQAATFATTLALEGLTKRVGELERNASSGAGRATGLQSAGDMIFRTLPMLLAVVSVIVSVLMFLELRAQ